MIGGGDGLLHTCDFDFDSDIRYLEGEGGERGLKLERASLRAR